MKLVLQDFLESETFLQQYIEEDATVMKHYDYSLNKSGIMNRYEELSNRTYNREALIVALRSFNGQFTKDPATYTQIDRLKDNNSVVVVGGQQAGLLTGPIYTINKIISILHEAKRVEKQLEVPVIPIFWIAGEDHDIDEVNHTYFHNGKKTKKLLLGERNDIKTPVSNRNIKMEDAKALIKDGLKFLKETVHTKEVYESLIADINEDVTYVQWFAKIIHRLFKGTGLVLMDAADNNIREIERPYFREIIEMNNEVRQAFCEGATSFKSAGFGEPIEIDEKNAHLFIHDQGQRFLLEKEGDIFKERNSGIKWEKEILLRKLEDQPQLFSNNVVTRPIVQDKLLPVVSFISGPGELKYWGTLKKVFHTLGVKMPIVFPRIHVSFVSRRTEKNLSWIHRTPHHVTISGLTPEKERWLKNEIQVDLDSVFTKLQEDLKTSLDNLATSLQPIGNIDQLHGRYSQILKSDIMTYEKRLKKQVLDQQAIGLTKFDEVTTEIRPDDMWQERYLNIIPILNEYGEDVVARLLVKLDKERSLLGKFLYVYL